MSAVLKQMNDLKTLLLEGASLGLTTAALEEKVDAAIRSLSDRFLRIVLMGSVSDGKTSVIAGLLEKVEENMKIARSESTDELAFYRFDDVDDMEIVDTPGLFGNKEKEIDGRVVKYSDITRKYISEADVLIYVCDAIVPVKASHVDDLRTVLRDFGKLDSTIFVLNKMDDAGVIMLDDESYKLGSDVKKQALIDRLRQTIGLTDDEEERLRVVCVAANPKKKGLPYWLERKEEYRKRSRLGLLRNEIDRVMAEGDIDDLKQKSALSVIVDVVLQIRTQLEMLIEPVEESMPDLKAKTDDLANDVAHFRLDLLESMRRLQSDLETYDAELNAGVDGCNLDTISSFLALSIGTRGNDITYHHVIRRINQYLSEANEANRMTIESAIGRFTQSSQDVRDVLTSALKKGAEALGKKTVTNTEVLKVRDFLAKHFKWAEKIKFAPHGAKNLAGTITQGFKDASGILAVLMELGDTIAKVVKAGKLKKLKVVLKSSLSCIFQQVYEMMNDENAYFENFAPSYLEMEKMLVESQKDLRALQEYLDSLKKYDAKLSRWVESVVGQDK